MDKQVAINRELFLEKLKDPTLVKGTTKSDERGRPVFDNENDKMGHCCCGVMSEMFGQTSTDRLSLPKAMRALGLTAVDCRFIQREINDAGGTLADNSDRIRFEVFGQKIPANAPQETTQEKEN